VFNLIQVELLSKKYEEKYKQVAELASKLAVDEAAFRDVQVLQHYTLEKCHLAILTVISFFDAPVFIPPASS
jgi:hypothetical protein